MIVLLPLCFLWAVDSPTPAKAAWNSVAFLELHHMPQVPRPFTGHIAPRAPSSYIPMDRQMCFGCSFQPLKQDVVTGYGSNLSLLLSPYEMSASGGISYRRLCSICPAPCIVFCRYGSLRLPHRRAVLVDSHAASEYEHEHEHERRQVQRGTRSPRQAMLLTPHRLLNPQAGAGLEFVSNLTAAPSFFAIRYCSCDSPCGE